MPAGLPGATSAQNQANPSQGQFVIMDALSGPKGSPFDKDPTGKNSTGAVQTGIGIGANLIINIANLTSPATAAQAIMTTDTFPKVSTARIGPLTRSGCAGRTRHKAGRSRD